MYSMKIVQGSQKHFTRDLTDLAPGANSDRTILPEPDGVRVKTTRFRCPANSTVNDIKYVCDETVLVESGKLQLTIDAKFNSEDCLVLQAGDHYHTPAGKAYSIHTLEDSVLFCVFSPVSENQVVDSN